MVVVPIIILALIIGIIFLKRYRRAKLPEFLRNKNVTKHRDIITEREIYIVSSKDKTTKKYIIQAYFVDDTTICRRAIVKEPYGFMLYEDGRLSVVPRGYVLGLLERVRAEKGLDSGKDHKTDKLEDKLKSEKGTERFDENDR